jgi:hypothetical protein
MRLATYDYLVLPLYDVIDGYLVSRIILVGGDQFYVTMVDGRQCSTFEGPPWLKRRDWPVVFVDARWQKLYVCNQAPLTSAESRLGEQWMYHIDLIPVFSRKDLQPCTWDKIGCPSITDPKTFIIGANTDDNRSIVYTLNLWGNLHCMFFPNFHPIPLAKCNWSVNNFCVPIYDPYHKRIWALCRENININHEKLSMYDIGKDQWEMIDTQPLTQINKRGNWEQLLVNLTNVYIVGGANYTSSMMVDVFDKTTRLWTTMNMDEYEIPIPTDLIGQILLQKEHAGTLLQLPKVINVLSTFQQSRATAIMLDNKIAMIGGLVETNYHGCSYYITNLLNRAITTFDLITHRRQLVAVLPEARTQFSALVIP